MASSNGASTIVITAGQAAVSGSIRVTINNGCVSSATLTKGVLVNAAPFAVKASASQAIICAGSSVSLTSSATINEQVFLINEKFNLATNNWNKINSSNNSGNRELSAWLLKPSGHTTFQDVIYSNDNSQFYISDSNAQNSTNGNTSTQLESPSFSLAGLSSATFTFYHFYRDWPDNSDNAKVQIRTNNGTTWTTWTDLVTYTSTQGANNNFALASINLNAYLGQAIVQVRFNYLGTNDYYWAVDNVQVSGIKNPAMSTGSYAWTSVPAGFTSNVMNPTSVAPTQTTTYTVTVSNGSACTTSASTTVTVNAASVGGTIAGGNTSICAGTSSVLTLSGKVGNVIRWESLTNPATSWIPIDNTTTILPTGPITSQIKFRAVVKNGICSEVFSEEATIVPGGQTTWKITAPATTAAWDNGTPDSSKKAIISADYAEAVDINACSLTVTDGATASVPAGFIVTLESSLIVDSGSSLTFNSNAHLIQKGNTNQNIGNVTIKRNSSALKRLDYTLWSSPVIGSQSLADFSPATTANHFYNYNSLTDLYEVSSNLSSFNLAKGYLIRMPNNSSAITPTIYEGSFIGKPNSGDISIAMVNTTNDKPRRFNLVGNPYPSPISAIKFVEDNATNITGALYFWRKTNDSTQPSYYTWTTTGLTAPLFGIAADQTVVNVENYNKMIQTGQGFFVEAKGNATNLVFNNSMRTTNLTNQFFRAATSTEYNRIWLNATNAEGWISQTLIGYFTNGQDELDSSDGRYVNDGDIALTSIINEEAYAIQGKSLPFDPTDAIDLQLKVKKAGTYTIAIDHLDGLFEGSQEIFLRDTEIGTDHNLKLSSYVFTADAGTYNSRFKLVYQNYLGLVDDIFNANTIAVAKKNNAISITAGSYLINSVHIFDLQGRKIYSKSNIDSSIVSITDLSIANQIILVQISTDNGTVTKKLQF